MSNIALKVEGLSKQYRIGKQERYRTFRDTITDALTAPARRIAGLLSGNASAAANLTETIWALRDINFEVRHGEVVGIIGRNGAGKSTLLKILSRITEPTEGTIDIFGRVGALLEVGTGFHPELTGRENVYLNGAILGMSREDIRRKFDEIVDFAGVEKFIDTPVKHYSSGMGLRLGFAVAAHLEPDILIVDEVLAVGDAEFQKKCIGKMSEVAGEGRTVLFVSHNMAAVQKLCSVGIYLNAGSIQEIADTRSVVTHYLSDTISNETITLKTKSRSGTGSLLATNIRFYNLSSRDSGVLRNGEPVRFEIDYTVPLTDSYNLGNVSVAIGIDSENGERIVTLWSKFTNNSLFSVEKSGTFICDIPRFFLRTGTYYIHIYVDSNGEVADYIANAGQIHVNSGAFYDTAIEPNERQGYLLVEHNWVIANTEMEHSHE
jgi:lipopolysaccharide transport system ATP-binding protein